MYTLIRRIHLFTGVFLLVFVVMYAVTGYVIIHRPWFPRGEARKTTRTERIAYKGDRSTPEFRKHLQEHFDLRGNSQPSRTRRDGSLRLEFVRPGANIEVVIPKGSDQATIARSEPDAVSVANGLHRLHGYGGGALYDLWAFVFDLASSGMILFALSGIWLWQRSSTVRWPGWLCLGLGCGFTATTILWFMYSR